jgi:DNA processing protein
MTTGDSATQRAALVALLRHVEDKKVTAHTALRARFTEGETPLDVLRQLGANLLIDETEHFLELGQADIDGWSAGGYPLTAFGDEDYPARLRAVHDYPLVLFATGQIPRDERGIAIVGTRNPSEMGAAFARRLAEHAANSGIAVISGLAKGIDTHALSAALNAGGRVAAIIGSGLKHSYPAENAPLQRRIAQRGLVLSQFFPEARPARAHFPIRNHTMSAYSVATVIVEAGETSGTRIQAKAAIRHGRPLVITRQVAVQTAWGREILDDGYDVTMVSSPDEALEAVKAIASREIRFENWLHERIPG